MPSRPNTPCRHPGCAALVPYGTKYCERHRPLHPEDSRSAAVRGYGKAWQKARANYLASHPLCVECMKEGRYVKATDVDHIVPHRGDKKLTSFKTFIFIILAANRNYCENSVGKSAV